MGKLPIIQTKISPPNVKDTILRRSKLIKKLHTIKKHAVTFIHSGPGYGKSTALATFFYDSTTPICWYSLSNNDDDILPFLTYLTYSIRKQYPDFGSEILIYIERIDRYLRDEEIRTMCSIFINEVVLLHDEIVVILDDFHLVQNSLVIDVWFEWLLNHFPNNLHIIFSSRIKPAWEILTTLKVKGEVLEINQHDLMLSKDEVEVFLSDYYEQSLVGHDIEQIYQLTEGWIIAIKMIQQQLFASGDLEGILNNKAKSLDDLFRFLAMEVFMKQPPMIQQFLEQTSIFDEVSSSLCDYVLGINGSNTMLESLANKNLFLISIGDGLYRYHALFKDFLEAKLLENEQQCIHLHQRSSKFFLQKGHYDQAILHLEAIKDYESVAKILYNHGQKMIEKGQLEGLLDRLRIIPEEIKNQNYLLWYYEGEVLRYRCAYQEAEECYKKAAKMANMANDSLGEGNALIGQTKIYLDTIQPGKAERILQSAIYLLEKNDAVDNEEKSKLYQLMAENLANAGQVTKARKWFDKGKKLNIPIKEGNLEARLFLRSGKLLDARQILFRNKQNNHEDSSFHLQQSHRETNLLLSLIEAFIGNGDSAKRLAQSGIEQGVKFKAPFVEACGWIRMGHALQLIQKYELSLAKQCYETALTIMEELNVSRGKAEPLMGLCLLYGTEKSYEMAIQYGKEALIETEKVKDGWLSALIQLCMGISAVYCEKWKESLRLLENAQDSFQLCEDQFGIMISELWKAISYFEQKMLQPFYESFSQFLNYVQTSSSSFLIEKQTLFGPKDSQRLVPLLLAAQDKGIHYQFVCQLLQNLGFSNMKSHPGYTLRIQALGQFRVWLGDNEIEEKGWQRGKAKELFELFVTKRNTLLTKEEIISLLWGDSDEKIADRDFKVALNALNNTLEPNRQARKAPFFIQRVGSSYGLNAQVNYQLDTMEFEHWIIAGLNQQDTIQSIAFLKKGLSFYEGDYLPERRYDDWCLTERERLQVYFLRGSEQIAQLSVKMKLFDQAIYWCEKILDKDQTWEEAYRLLMYCYYQKNNRPQAIRWYHKCSHILQEELGVEPMQATKQMYEMIIHEVT